MSTSKKNGQSSLISKPMRSSRGSRPEPTLSDHIGIVDASFGDFDPEGWMSERPTYWADVPQPEPPTRLAWLRHRMRQAASYFGVSPPEPTRFPRVGAEEWTRLSEVALGPLQRRGDFVQRQEARPAEPDSRNTASKPTASSPESRPPGDRDAG